MSLPQPALDRLARLGYAAESEIQFWRWLWESEGESFFWGFLQRDEEAAEEYSRWFPQLKSYAAECRRAVPVPAVEAFTTVEREQYRVLLTKMQEFEKSENRRCVLGRKPHQAAILWTTRVGLAAAEQVFGGTDAVILREEETEKWFADVYPGVGDGFWWYAEAWWLLREDLSREDEYLRSRVPPPGCSYWVVITGLTWGSLAGGCHYELWKWDGTTAEFAEFGSVVTF